jgi:hypothetical protein
VLTLVLTWLLALVLTLVLTWLLALVLTVVALTTATGLGGLLYDCECCWPFCEKDRLFSPTFQR